MGYIFTVVTISLLWVVETIGPSTCRRNNGPYTGRRHNGPSMGRIINGPYTGRMIDWPNMGQTDRILAVNGLELISSIQGPTITGRR